MSLDGLLQAASYYRKSIAENEAQAEALRKSLPDMSLMDSQVVAEFSALRLQRETLINEVIAKMPDFIGPEGAQALRKHIDERVKPRTKIVPGPQMPVAH